MAYAPQYYPGSTSTSVRRRIHHSVPINKDADRIDLYSDRGVLLKSDVDLSASPLRNAAMQRLVSLTKRSVATTLGECGTFGVPDACRTPKKKRGAKGGHRSRPSERRPGLSDLCLCTGLVFTDYEKSPAEIRNEKAVRRAEAEQRQRKRCRL